MDFDLEIDEQEREQCMVFNVDGMELSIPEGLVEERMRLMDVSLRDMQILLAEQAQIYKESLLFNHSFNPNNFEQMFVKYLDNEMSIYRP